MTRRPPFAVAGLDHVVLLVDDMAAAQHFYREVVGCTVERDMPQYGMAQLRAGAALIDLVDIGSEAGAWARPEVTGGRNVDHVALDTGDWDEAAMRAHLAAHDIEIVEEGLRGGAKDEDLSFYVRDPAGNQIELKRSR
ncbi:VOC family protein [Sphingosinicella sp.]|uniref:VOC family protein n=1 Tax=Sphingosinicella sp. TaxID=1917971 RepID=UPI0040376809